MIDKLFLLPDGFVGTVLEAHRLPLIAAIIALLLSSPLYAMERIGLAAEDGETAAISVPIEERNLAVGSSRASSVAGEIETTKPGDRLNLDRTGRDETTQGNDSVVADDAAVLPWADASSIVLPKALSGVMLSGPLVQGGLLQGRVIKGDRVLLGDKELYVGVSGRFVLGLDRDAPLSQSLQFVRADQSYNVELKVEKRDYNVQRIEGVEQKYVTPDPEQQARSRRDVQRVVAARAILLSEETYGDGFQWPAIGPISGVFGSQRVYNGVPRRPHYGIDIAREIGTPVMAPAGGVVRLAEDLYFSGLTIIIDHGHYLSSSFLHLDSMDVKVGDIVEKGEKIGGIGATGRVTGAHLDWRMNWTGGQGNIRIDPELLVPPMPAQ